jgi:hypothetical protein
VADTNSTIDSFLNFHAFYYYFVYSYSYKLISICHLLNWLSLKLSKIRSCHNLFNFKMRISTIKFIVIIMAIISKTSWFVLVFKIIKFINCFEQFFFYFVFREIYNWLRRNLNKTGWLDKIRLWRWFCLLKPVFGNGCKIQSTNTPSGMLWIWYLEYAMILRAKPFWHEKKRKIPKVNAV